VNNANNFDLLTTPICSQRQGDLAFSASFDVPEPTSGSMILVGMLGLLVADKGIERKRSN
jgi:hypothetical protein